MWDIKVPKHRVFTPEGKISEMSGVLLTDAPRAPFDNSSCQHDRVFDLATGVGCRACVCVLTKHVHTQGPTASAYAAKKGFAFPNCVRFRFLHLQKSTSQNSEPASFMSHYEYAFGFFCRVCTAVLVRMRGCTLLIPARLLERRHGSQPTLCRNHP